MAKTMAKKSEIATWKKEKRKEKKRVRDRAAAAASAAVIKYYFRYFTISLVLFNGSVDSYDVQVSSVPRCI